MITKTRIAATLIAFVALAPARAQQANATSPRLDDPTIIAIFDAANTWDMETGAIAEKKGTTKEVRDFAAQLVRDHRTVRQQGRELARSLGVTPTPPTSFGMARDHAAAVTKLDAANGKAFDKVFLEQEIAFHKAVLDAATSTLLPDLHNQQVKSFVARVAPLFTAHMEKAQSMLNMLNASNTK